MTTPSTSFSPFLLEAASSSSAAQRALPMFRIVRRIVQLLQRGRHRLRAWNRRGEERAFLASLQEFELRAMGLSLAQRDDEVNKPLWEA